MFCYIYFKIVIMEDEEVIPVATETVVDEWDNHIGDHTCFF
jgi:hypothetical protein